MQLRSLPVGGAPVFDTSTFVAQFLSVARFDVWAWWLWDVDCFLSIYLSISRAILQCRWVSFLTWRIRFVSFRFLSPQTVLLGRCLFLGCRSFVRSRDRTVYKMAWDQSYVEAESLLFSMEQMLLLLLLLILIRVPIPIWYRS